MRVFISADIEGTTYTTLWGETNLGYHTHAAAAKQMTAEVLAACEGAIAAGATEIVVKDAHDDAVNIDPTVLPECVSVIRGWSGDPMGMVEGIDESFDAVMFVGYHAAAGRNGNPLSHTETRKTTTVKLNGKPCSEYMLFSWACALKGVPTVLLCGDKNLIDDSEGLHPKAKLVAVKDGFGGATRSLNPKLTCKMIREAAEEALKQDLSDAGVTLPEHFVFEVSFREHPDAVRRSFFPGFKQTGDHTITMETDNFMDVLTAVQFVC